MSTSNNNSKRVLLVEDDEMLREVLQEEFINGKIVVVTAVSGNQAVRILREDSNFDAIITDIQMPDGNGLFLLEQIQKMTFTKQPLIIMMSGYSDLSSSELMKKGAHAVLPKPFELEELIKLTHRIINI